MSFQVINPGFYSSVQDLGRFGLAHVGLGRSGVMDEHAFRWGNYLLENQQNDAGLEITFGQCELVALADTLIAVTGADLNFEINGENKANWQTHKIAQGDRLKWRSMRSGVRAYLTVKGGLQTTEYLFSRSVNQREHVGELIKKNDKIDYYPYTKILPSRSVPQQFRPDYTTDLVLRLLPSYQFDLFSASQQKTLLGQQYQLSHELDRTGFRLEGEPIKNVPAQMVSEPMVYGSVEITSAGYPIILLNDAPTIGGYPKIGTILSLDLARLTQLQPGRFIQFELINIEKAQALRLAFQRFFGQ